MKFMRARPGEQRKHIVDWFELHGQVEVNIEASRDSGFVRINSIELRDTTAGVNSAGKWTGIYFNGVPIRVTAVPKRGYGFHRWEAPEDFDVSTESLVLNLMNEARLKAVFLAPE